LDRKRVLLVDDSATSLLLERMILSRGHYEVVTAGNGVEAIEKARVLRPDVIVMDVMMPEMGGIEACRRMRDDAATRGIPIILVTTRGEPENVEAGYESGCNEYVTKPVDAIELLAKVESVLAKGPA
jgi:CheY-like chemotaxis protein